MSNYFSQGNMMSETRNHFIKFFGTFFIFFLFSCSKGSDAPLGPDWPSTTVSVSSITVSPASVSLSGGDSQTFTATGGDGTFTWSITDTSLGSIDSSTGVFTAGGSTGTLTVTATDSNGDTGTASVTIVEATITIEPSSANVAASGSQTFSASGGTGTYSWSISDETLGLVTSEGVFTAGSITGTLTITATDDSGNTGSATITIT